MSAPTITITEPGVYDLPEDAYHRDPVPAGSLSASGARKLLPPHCPARYAYERDNPPASTPVFDFGKAAHELVLGAGNGIAVIHADDWRTKDARAFRDAAYANGQTPLLAADYERVTAMADAIGADPNAAALFAEGAGLPEQSLFWVDDRTGMWCRARLDWLPHPREGRRLVVPDYKTCRSADPGELSRSVHSYGYYLQAAHYLAGVRALGLDPDPAFVFVAQEKDPPYLVHTFQLDAAALRAGEARRREALDVFAACQKTGIWPGYPTDITVISLPAWANTEEY